MLYRHGGRGGRWGEREQGRVRGGASIPVCLPIWVIHLHYGRLSRTGLDSGVSE